MKLACRALSQPARARRAAAPLIALVLALLAPGLAAQDSAAAYPNRPVKFINQYSPGGLGDTFARALAQHLAERLGQPFLVENRTGANGIIAAEIAAKSPADGYTLFMGTQSGLVLNAATRKSLPFDLIRDFAPISLLFSTPFYLVVHPSVKATSVAELVALARSQPGKLTYASLGRGSGHHLAAEQFSKLTGIDIVHVPYKGSGQAMTDLLSGQVHMMFEGPVSGLPPVRSGKLRALATSGARRTAAAPELPTMIEAGVAGFDISTWFGFVAPSGTPRSIIDRLNGETRQMLTLPATAQRFAAFGIDLLPSTPEQMAERIRVDLPFWTKIMRDAGIEAE